MLNIAGPEYDFAHVVFAVIQECEHRRRGLSENAAEELSAIARGKLARIRAAYDEFGGSNEYWSALQTEVLETALPQYIPAALEMNTLERSGWGVFRRGDLAARILFAVGGLFLGLLFVLVPYLRVLEGLFAVGFAMGGFFYPDLVRFMHERRHARLLNRLVVDAAAYQQNAKLHYMTSRQIRDSFSLGGTTEADPVERDRQAE